MKKSLYITFAIGAAVLSAVPACAQNLITNGSFEQGNYSWNGSNGESLSTGSTAITGWTVIEAELAPIKNGDAYGMVAEDGDISLDLTGYHDSSPYGGVEQSLGTTIGQGYVLQFYVGVLNGGSIYQSPNSVDAIINSSDVGTFTNSSTASGQQWALETYRFTAASASTTIGLIGHSSGGGQYIGLDNVSLEAVPEPSGLVLAAGSILGLLGFRRRRA